MLVLREPFRKAERAISRHPRSARQAEPGPTAGRPRGRPNHTGAERPRAQPGGYRRHREPDRGLDRGKYLHALDSSGKILYHFPTTLGSSYDRLPPVVSRLPASRVIRTGTTSRRSWRMWKAPNRTHSFPWAEQRGGTGMDGAVPITASMEHVRRKPSATPPPQVAFASPIGTRCSSPIGYDRERR